MLAYVAMTLKNKRVVVIGGATGIGFAIAELAAADGADVVVASSSEANVNAAVGRLPNLTGLQVDLRDEAGVAAFFERLGPFDHLAITSGDWGGTMYASVRELDFDQARNGLTVRFWGSIAAVKYGARTIAADGSITLTSGMLAHRPVRSAPMTTAIAGAMEHLARGLAMDLAPVRVNAVCPGIVLTEHVKAQMPPGRLQAYTAALPIARSAEPAEAAAAYVYLMQSTYATGQILPVDGGGLLV